MSRWTTSPEDQPEPDDTGEPEPSVAAAADPGKVLATPPGHRLQVGDLTVTPDPTVVEAGQVQAVLDAAVAAGLTLRETRA